MPGAKNIITILIGTAISLLSLIGFIGTSTSTMPQLKYLAIAFYVLATLALFTWLASSTGRLQLIRAVWITGILSLFTEQVLAFLSFTGLAKDVVVFSGEHFANILFLIAFVSVWYFIVASLALLLVGFARKLTRLRS